MKYQQQAWIDRPIRQLKRFPRSKGMNLVPVEHLLEQDRFLRPIGVAIEKEFGKRLTSKEYLKKAITKDGIDVLSLGLSQEMLRVNNQLKKQIRRHIR